MEKKKDISSGDHIIVTAPIVIKNEYNEMYLRRSIQDYFIKFSESVVSFYDMSTHLSAKNDLTNTITVAVEFRDGFWDDCKRCQNRENRKGTYAIIHKIIS